MNLAQIADNLEYRDGVWFSKTRSEISYPENANDECHKLEDTSFWFNHRNDCIVEVVKQFISFNESFFDVGGGNGFVSSGLQKAGIETILVEPDEKGIVNAKKRNLRNLLCATLENALFRKDSLPNIGLFDVLEHVEGDREFLKKAFFCLKPDGNIFITTPAYSFLWSNEDEEDGHFRRYTLKALQGAMEASGFKVVYKTYFFSFLPLPILLFRTLPSRLGGMKKNGSQERHKIEHEKKGLLGEILEAIQTKELSFIKKNKSMLFGGSCLIVGSKMI